MTEDAPKKKIVYVECGEAKQLKNSLSFACMRQYIKALQKDKRIQDRLDIQIFRDAKQWLSQCNKEDPWIIIFSGELERGGFLKFGNELLTYEEILNRLEPNNHKKLACIVVNAANENKQFQVKKRHDGGFQPAWAVFNPTLKHPKYKEEVPLSAHTFSIKFFCDFLFKLIYKNQSMLDALTISQEANSAYDQIKVHETFCVTARTPGIPALWVEPGHFSLRIVQSMYVPPPSMAASRSKWPGLPRKLPSEHYSPLPFINRNRSIC